MKRLILIVIILSFIRCQKPHEYPASPIIDFLYLTVLDTSDALGNPTKNFDITFKIVDGDYNFGFKDSDTNDASLNFNNFHIDIYTSYKNKVNKITNDTINYDGKIPWVEPIGIQKYFKATVTYSIYLYNIIYDSIYFEFYVMDRAKNKSNTEKTMWIPRSFTGILVDTTKIIN